MSAVLGTLMDMLQAPRATAAPSGKTSALATRVKAADAELHKLTKLLSDYYTMSGSDGEKLHGSRVLHAAFVLNRTHSGYAAGRRRLADKMARAVVWGDSFVLGTMGTSVTVGHGNCATDNYQQQLQRLMAPVWAAAGVAFEIRNAGQGGGCADNQANQAWCVRNTLGDDVDVMHYSWCAALRRRARAGARPGHAQASSAPRPSGALGAPRTPRRTYFEFGQNKAIMNSRENWMRFGLRTAASPVPLIIEVDTCSDGERANASRAKTQTRRARASPALCSRLVAAASPPCRRRVTPHPARRVAASRPRCRSSSATRISAPI